MIIKREVVRIKFLLIVLIELYIISISSYMIIYISDENEGI